MCLSVTEHFLYESESSKFLGTSPESYRPTIYTTTLHIYTNV